MLRPERVYYVTIFLMVTHEHPKGFSAIETVLIAVFIILLAGAGWYVWHQRHMKTAVTSTAKTDQSQSASTSAVTQSSQTLIIAAAKTFCDKDSPGQYGIATSKEKVNTPVTVNKIEGEFASANVACGSSVEYTFVKNNGAWKVVYQGQEPPQCDQVRSLVQYKIPVDILKCFDSSGTEVPIQ